MFTSLVHRAVCSTWISLDNAHTLFPLGSLNCALCPERGVLSAYLTGRVSVSLAAHRKTHLFSRSHMTSSGGTEQLPKSLQDKHYKPPPRGGVGVVAGLGRRFGI